MTAARMAEMYDLGMGPVEIARRAGVSRETVRRRLHARGVELRGRRGWGRSLGVRLGAVSAYEEGEAVPAIARRAGVSERTVRAWVAAAGVPRPAPVPDVCRTEARRMLDEGHSYSATARRVGVAHTTVARWARRWGMA